MTKSRLLILSLHGIGDPPPQAEGERWNWLTRDGFRAVLDAARGRSDVRLTFDDSYRSDLDVALPALLERGLTASFFVVGSRIGKPDYLSREGVRSLADAGMTIGSHGMDHRAWRRLTKEEMRYELRRSRSLLEDLAGHAVQDAACPYGVYDRRTLAGLRQAGYRRVFTSDGGWADSGAWLQPRTSLARDEASEVAELLAAGGAPERPRVLRRVKMAIKRWR